MTVDRDIWLEAAHIADFEALAEEVLGEDPRCVQLAAISSW